MKELIQTEECGVRGKPDNQEEEIKMRETTITPTFGRENLSELQSVI